MRVLERLGPSHLALRQRVETEVAAVSPVQRSLELDRRMEFDRQLRDRLGEIGILGLGVPAASGGSGGDAVDLAIALEVLGRHNPSMAVYCVVNFLVTRMFNSFGSDSQKAEWLAPILKGHKQGAFCLTESGGGTDILANTLTVARRSGGNWVVQGEKTWISGAGDADVMLVVARTAEHRTRGLTVFAIPSKSRGISTVRLETMALNGFPCYTVKLDGVEVPESAVVGTVNEGLGQIMTALNGERINAAAVVNGIARGALEAALGYAKERQAFGRPVGQFQAVQHRLAASAAAIEMAWSAVLDAARRDSEGEATDIASALAKWASSKAALGITDTGMELFAASGFLVSQVMQRYFRDARLHVFAPVNNDMIMNLLGERWLGLPRAY